VTRLYLLMVAVGTLALSACANTFDAQRLGLPVTVSSPVEAPPEGSHFKVTSHAVYAFWGVAQIGRPSLDKALAAQLAGAKGIANLKIKVRSRWGDVLVTVLTLGLIVPRSVTFEGVILQSTPPTPPPPPAPSP
jgi:hypothetical protein